MALHERLQNIDRRIIYVVLLLAISLPFLFPIGLPVTASSGTQTIYDAIEALPTGSVVGLSFDYTPGTYSEIHPQAIAVFQHVLMRPDLKAVLFGFWQAGPMFADEILQKEQVDLMGKEYGIDFVNLGFIPGGEAGMAAFAADIHATAPVDHAGNNIADLPMMADIKTANDIGFLFSFNAGNPGIVEMLRQVQGPYKIEYAAGGSALAVPINMPYVNSGQMIGLLSGLSGAAEYESLIAKPAMGIASMDAISMSQLVIIFFIILGNIGFFLNKNRQRKVGDIV